MSLRASLFLLAGAPSLFAQQPVTRAQAVAAALARGTRAAFGRADSAAAAGALHGARLYPNPLLSATYTKDVPHYHLIADLPLDLPWIRAARIGAAASARDAVRYDVAFERAAIVFDVDTAYTRALAARAHAQLSRRNAVAADSLHQMAQLRREVGDVSELDVNLAAVNAGQLENAAADDSLAAIEALVALQLAMGLPGDAVTIALVDSLASPSGTVPAAPEVPLPVAAAAARSRKRPRRATGRGRLWIWCSGRRERSWPARGAASPWRWRASSAAAGCSRAPTASPPCRCKHTPKAPSRSRRCSKRSATGARRWVATSTTSLPPTTPPRPCDSSRPLVASHEARLGGAARARGLGPCLPRPRLGRRVRLRGRQRCRANRPRDGTAVRARRTRHRHGHAAAGTLRRARRTRPAARRPHFRRRRPAGQRGRFARRVRACALRRRRPERRHGARGRAAQLCSRRATRAGGDPAAKGCRPGRLRAGAGASDRDHRAPQPAARHAARPPGGGGHPHDRRARRLRRRQPAARPDRGSRGARHRLQRVAHRGCPAAVGRLRGAENRRHSAWRLARIGCRDRCRRGSRFGLARRRGPHPRAASRAGPADR